MFRGQMNLLKPIRLRNWFDERRVFESWSGQMENYDLYLQFSHCACTKNYDKQRLVG